MMITHSAVRPSLVTRGGPRPDAPAPRGAVARLHPRRTAGAGRIAHGAASGRRTGAGSASRGIAVLAAAPADDAQASDEADAFRQQLMASAGGEEGEEVEGGTMTGEELREVVMARWGRAYDTRICQKRDRFNRLRLYVQVMWKFLGQKTFPLTEQQYNDQLDAVAELLTEWGVADKVREDIEKCAKNPVLDTTGANAVMIPLDVEANVRL